MKHYRIRLTICTLALMAMSGTVLAENSGAGSKNKNSTKAQPGSSKKNKVCKECGKLEKECKCKNEKHEDSHEGHVH